MRPTGIRLTIWLPERVGWLTRGGFPFLPDGTPANYEINLDLVVFADGSTFGPKKSQESDELLGMIEGIGGADMKSPEISADRER